jgi:hypothetical protein
LTTRGIELGDRFLFTVADLTVHLHPHQSTIYKLLKRGKLPVGASPTRKFSLCSSPVKRVFVPSITKTVDGHLVDSVCYTAPGQHLQFQGDPTPKPKRNQRRWRTRS